MSFKRNLLKEEMIGIHGEGYGLPLFGQSSEPSKCVAMPDWIWDGNGVKAPVYYTMKEKFAEDSFEYLHALLYLGGSATDHEVKDYFGDADRWPLHIVSARRNYFCGEPLNIVKSYPDQTKMGPKGKPNTIWFVDFKQLYIIIHE